jgi:hypothetical protein
MTTNPFEASAPLTGYLYQCRFALLEAVQRAAKDPQFSVRVEALDDVEFSDAHGAPKDILQLKHHREKRAASLSDASTDLWHTLRIWCVGTSAGTIGEDVVAYLVTTSRSAPGSAASYLGRTARSPADARAHLDNTAMTSTSDTNKLAYAAYMALSKEAKEALLERVFIIDSAPDIQGVQAELHEALSWAVPSRSRILALAEALEGWWIRRVVQSLTDPTRPSVLGADVDSKIRELGGQFQPDNLPIDESIIEASLDDEAYTSDLFVQQLDLISLSKTKILHAIRNYFRAYTQRNVWLDDGHLQPGDLKAYDRRLREEWEHHFETMKEDLDTEADNKADEQAMREAARRLYNKIHELEVPIGRRKVASGERTHSEGVVG